MTVGSGVEKTGGAVLLYRSKDLRQWTYLHMLASGRWNGQSGSDVVATGEMWECPEFFPLEGKHILIYSTEGKVYWQSGTLDNETMTFHAERDGLLDLGSCYYAPKTQVDSSGRRILWGWIREKRTEEQLHAAGWAGMMSLPRVLSLTRDGSLRMQMLPQLRNQRGSSSEQSIQNACGEFVCTSTQSAAAVFELSIRTPQEELLRIRSSADGSSLLIEDISVPLGTSQGIRVHGYLDGSVVEIIVNDRIAHTKRFYNHDATAPEIQFHAAGATLEVWNVRPISQDRLTS
jgi:beta-fructofuranosidase